MSVRGGMSCCAWLLLAVIGSWPASSTAETSAAETASLDAEPRAASMGVGQPLTAGMLLGQAFGAGAEGMRSPSVALSEFQRAAQAAVYRAEADVKARGGMLGAAQVEENALGESGPSKIAWTYENSNWEKWPLCRMGIKQSPVDLKRPFFGAFLKLKQKYKDQLWPIQKNDGRVLRVKFKTGDGSVLGIGDKEFTPTEAIFHSPSEHKIDGRPFDMEMQIMHKDTAGNQVGLSVLMQVSTNIPKDNFYVQDVFAHFFQNLPKVGHERRTESMNLKWILNKMMLKHYITYHGSITTPPCTEGVEWFVLGRPWLVEKKWLDSFKKAVTTPNVRPTQARGDRMFKSF